MLHSFCQEQDPSGASVRPAPRPQQATAGERTGRSPAQAPSPLRGEGPAGRLRAIFLRRAAREKRPPRCLWEAPESASPPPSSWPAPAPLDPAWPSAAGNAGPPRSAPRPPNSSPCLPRWAHTHTGAGQSAPGRARASTSPAARRPGSAPHALQSGCGVRGERARADHSHFRLPPPSPAHL